MLKSNKLLMSFNTSCSFCYLEKRLAYSHSFFKRSNFEFEQNHEKILGIIVKVTQIKTLYSRITSFWYIFIYLYGFKCAELNDNIKHK